MLGLERHGISSASYLFLRLSGNAVVARVAQLLLEHGWGLLRKCYSSYSTTEMIVAGLDVFLEDTDFQHFPGLGGLGLETEPKVGMPVSQVGASAAGISSSCSEKLWRQSRQL